MQEENYFRKIFSTHEKTVSLCIKKKIKLEGGDLHGNKEKGRQEDRKEGGKEEGRKEGYEEEGRKEDCKAQVIAFHFFTKKQTPMRVCFFAREYIICFL
jgi:hypothetical protein